MLLSTLVASRKLNLWQAIQSPLYVLLLFLELTATMFLLDYCRGNKRGRGGPAAGGAANAYVRISEQEIADDYPLPAQYEKEEEEADELLLWDEEMAWMDPEDLPKQLLDDFSIYNAEVGCRV